MIEWHIYYPLHISKSSLYFNSLPFPPFKSFHFSGKLSQNTHIKKLSQNFGNPLYLTALIRTGELILNMFVNYTRSLH